MFSVVVSYVVTNYILPSKHKSSWKAMGASDLHARRQLLEMLALAHASKPTPSVGLKEAMQPQTYPPAPEQPCPEGTARDDAKCWELSEMRFCKVSWRTVPCLRGKQLFQVLHAFPNSLIFIWIALSTHGFKLAFGLCACMCCCALNSVFVQVPL